MIFILIFVFLVGTSKLFPFINGPLASIKTTVPIYAGPGAKPYTFTWVAVPGVMIFIATILGGLYQGASIGKIAQVFKDNFVGLRFTYLTIIAVVVVAKIMTYSGMTKEIADALVFATGNAYPIVAPFVGGLGAFITGSCTNANVLFGPLQTSVASSLGMSHGSLVPAPSVVVSARCFRRRVSLLASVLSVPLLMARKAKSCAVLLVTACSCSSLQVSLPSSLRASFPSW